MDLSNVPIISLAGVTTLSDVLSELPLPTPVPELVGGPTQTLYFHHRVAQEAEKFVQSTDPNLVGVVSNLLATKTADHVVLKDEYNYSKDIDAPLPVDEILSSNSTAPALLKMVLQRNKVLFSRQQSGSIPSSSYQSQVNVINTTEALPTTAVAITGVNNSPTDNVSASRANTDGHNDEIPENLRHLFHNVPVVQIEPMDVLRAQAMVSNDHDTKESKSSESVKKRIISIGKQPKAFSQGGVSVGSKKKRTMISELFDSLTPAAEYFAEGSRRRRTVTRNYNECGQPSNMDEEMSKIYGEEDSADEKASKSKSQRDIDYSSDSQPELERYGMVTEATKEREKRLRENMIKRKEKRRRLSERAGGIYQMIDSTELVQNESFRKFCAAIDTVFDNAEDFDISAEMADDEDEIPAECLIPKHVMMELCSESNKLKILGAMNRVPIDRVTKLITMLQKNVKDGSKLLPLLDERQDGDESVSWREETNDRVLRSADAALIAMTIMTSPGMPKQVFIEDAIERCVAFVKFQLQNAIFAAFDPVYRVSKDKGAADSDGGSDVKQNKRSRGSSAIKSKLLLSLYGKISELIGCFADLVEAQTLTDTTILQLSSLGVAPFFVENIGELQLHALRLVANIFGHYPKHRKLILEDILASLARLPSTKRGMRTYRLNANEYIQMVSALVMQLIQSVVKVPFGSSSSGGDEECSSDQAKTAVMQDADVMISTSYDTAMHMSHTFLSAYLKKCTTKSEEDHRPLFEAFVGDLLTAVHKPDWPAAELLLSLLGKLLVQYFSNKQIEMSLRVASLDYLGVVASRLRKDAVASNVDEAWLQQILRALTEADSDDYDQEIITADGGQLESKRIKIRFKKQRRNQHGTEDNIQILQRALIDYLTEQKENDSTAEFAKNFYIAQWYKDCASELTIAGQRRSSDENEPLDGDESDSKHNRNNRTVFEHEQSSAAAQKVADKKQFLLSLADREMDTDYGRKLRRNGGLLSEQDVAFVVRYLASKRPLSQSFDIYLAQIIRVLNETAVAVRTKAMRCLSSVVEVDSSVLGRNDIQQAVHARLLDHSSSVREAAVDLIGKFICAQPDFIDKYYKMVMDRMLDTGVSVRKRVIKIMKDICDRRPDFEKIPEICVRILRRAIDEESVKKLVVETFHNLWFVPVKERDTVTLLKKVMTIIDVVAEYSKDGNSQYDGFETVLSALLKKDGEKGALTAAGQVVNCLVENVLTLEEKMMDRPASHSRLLPCLTTLYLFSKVRPPLMVAHAETMQPYLLMNCTNKNEQAVLVQVVKILEMVVPLMEHPNPEFLSEIESNLIGLALKQSPQIIQACISCLSAVVNGLTKNYSLIQRHFFNLFDMLLKRKSDIESRPVFAAIPKEIKPSLLRSLFTLGLFCRYFDLDETYPEDRRPQNPWREQVLKAFLFFTGSKDEEVKWKALAALGALCIKHPDFMTRAEVKQFYCSLLLSIAPRHQNTSSVPSDREQLLDERLKVQVLKNIESFLKEEEAKLIKSNEQWDNSKKTEDLKELCESASGLGSSVIQHYLREVEECYFHMQTTVRAAACDVIILTLQQGLVHPAQCIPHVIAMQTDPDPAIRGKADKILKEVETKYPGFIQMKAGEGLKLSFRLQTILCWTNEAKMPNHQPKHGSKHGKSQGPQAIGNGARGLRMDGTNGPQALNSQLYSLIRTGRMQRRAFLKGLLQLFDENSQITFEEMIYIVDNLASFPYQIIEEPLFICHHVDIVVSVTGASLVQTFQEGLLPKQKIARRVPESYSQQYDVLGMQPGGFPAMNAAETGVTEYGNHDDDDDEDEITVEELLARLPSDVRHLEACILNAQGCLMLLSLKRYLKDIYGITDSKLQEYSPNESAKAYDKALNRRPTVSAFQPKYFTITAGNDLEKRIQLCQQFLEFKQMLMSIDAVNAGGGSDDEINQTDSDQQISGGGTALLSSKKRTSKGASHGLP